MYFYRIELHINCKKDEFYSQYKEYYLEYELLHYDNDMRHRYLIYPKEWIKYPNGKLDGSCIYSNTYLSPEQIIRREFGEYYSNNKIEATVYNPYTDELIYKYHENDRSE